MEAPILTKLEETLPSSSIQAQCIEVNRIQAVGAEEAGTAVMDHPRPTVEVDMLGMTGIPVLIQ